jgi:signal transduction histidine kinase
VNHPDGRHGAARHALGALMLLSLVVCGASAQSDRAPDSLCRVVLLNVGDPLLPAFIALDRATRDEIRAKVGRPVQFYAETLDMLRFPRAQLEQETVALLSKKYRGAKVEAVVAIETTALEFAESHGDLIWPDTPIIFHSVPTSYLARRTLSPRITGVPVRYDIEPTLELALRLRPATRRVVVIAGAGEFDHELIRLARGAIEGRAGKIDVEFLVDRSLAEARAAVGKLPVDAIVLFLSMVRGGDGAPHTSRNVVTQLAAASSVPIFGIFETYLSDGIVAGSIASFETQGRRAGDLVARVLKGERPADLNVQPPVQPGCIADWRQLKRWGIDESLLPDGCDVRFREISTWERYRWQIDLAILVMFAQTALIGALLFQRYRRRQAESAGAQLRVELAHAGRLVTIGELTAAIAHEVNQPLGAILANVDSAEMLLDSDDPRISDVRQILADIRKDDLRANDVIKRLRTLLAKHEMTRERIDLNETILEVLRVLEPEAQRRHVELVTEFDDGIPRILGDRVHLQQVLLNLVLNAMDAMADTHVTSRRVTVRTARRPDGDAEVTVSDRGHGIASEHLSKLFVSFYTTKQRGMGLGLSIAKSIVEAHGGRIWAEPYRGGGATFRFTLPVTGDSGRAATAERPA